MVVTVEWIKKYSTRVLIQLLYFEKYSFIILMGAKPKIATKTSVVRFFIYVFFQIVMLSEANQISSLN